MIVYAGKQFWNDFNNGDEALFQDAERPRDSDKFKIRPWMQSWKWDWRSANKNIYMAQALVRCIVKDPSWEYKMPSFKTKYASNDFSFLVGYTVNAEWWWTYTITSSDVAYLAEDCAIQSWQWDACISVENGNVVIKKSWTYILEAHAEFIYPTWFNAGVSYQYIEYVALKAYDEKNRRWNVAVWNTERACWTRSFRKANYVTYATAGSILNVEVWQTSWQNTMVNVWINAYRLS